METLLNLYLLNLNCFGKVKNLLQWKCMKPCIEMISKFQFLK